MVKLIVVSPGPTINVYRDGELVISVAVGFHTTMRLIADLSMALFERGENDKR